MLPTILNLLPISLSFITGFGVMLHDTKLDQAALTAMSSHTSSTHSTSPINSGPDVNMKSNDHTHAESVRIHHLGSQEPRLQTRDSDLKKFVATKKLAANASPS